MESSPMVDPNDTMPPDPRDTIPPPPSSPPSAPAPRRITREQLADSVIDHSARHLAEWCAGWRHRGYGPEDLVGIACNCRFICRPRVIRRADIGRKLPGSEIARALKGAGSRAGCLTVAVCAQGFSLARHIGLPTDLDVPDTRGLLVPLPPRIRAFLDQCLTHPGGGFARDIRKEQYQSPFDEMVVHLSTVGGLRGVWRRSEMGVLHHPWEERERPPKAQIDAAYFDLWPGRVLFMLSPDERYGETQWSAEWIDPRTLGFDEREVAEVERRCFRIRPQYELAPDA